MPLLAISEDFFGRLWSKYHQDLLVFDDTAKLLISRQHLTFIPLLMVAKFGKRRGLSCGSIDGPKGQLVLQAEASSPCAGLYLQTVEQLLHGKAYVHRGYETAAQAIYVAW